MPVDPIIELMRRLDRLERYLDDQKRLGPAFKGIVADFMLLPYLRGFWTFTSRDESDNVRDHSSQDRTLTNNSGAGLTELGNNNIWYVDLNGTTAYYSRADEAGLDITGALTLGGWFWADALPGTNAGLTGKYAAAGNQRSYLVFLLNTGVVRFVISSNGTATTTVDSAAISTGTWNFIAGRYTPSSEIAIFLNGVKATNVTSIPASLFNSTAALQIGAFEAANFLDGRAALCFLAASAISDPVLLNLYSRTRPLFQVLT